VTHRSRKRGKRPGLLCVFHDRIRKRDGQDFELGARGKKLGATGLASCLGKKDASERKKEERYFEPLWKVFLAGVRGTRKGKKRKERGEGALHRQEETDSLLEGGPDLRVWGTRTFKKKGKKKWSLTRVDGKGRF